MIHKIRSTLVLTLFFCKSLFSDVPQEAWNIIAPYQMSENHPIKEKLDELFSSQRAIHNQESLILAGFEDKAPEPRTGVFVVRHNAFKGYIFKLYTDDRLSYYRNEPEYVTWMLRARGAQLIRHEIKAKGWQKYFKAPKKWIYVLPSKPIADSHTLPKNFILVEEEMDIFTNTESKKKWRDGTLNIETLNRLFYLISKTGLRGGCKYDNIPVCKDGKIAFIDTQNNLSWPLPYESLGSGRTFGHLMLWAPQCPHGLLCRQCPHPSPWSLSLTKLEPKGAGILEPKMG